MRKFATLSLAIALIVLVSHGPAAPAPGDKPIRWEYAELSRAFILPAAQPGAPQARAQLNIRWSTADEEIEGSEWDDLANKLKAPPLKQAGSQLLQKLRLFNRLGADGWEIIEHTGLDGTTGGRAHWTFKRRAP
jgi:hypothetical protein